MTKIDLHEDLAKEIEEFITAEPVLPPDSITSSIVSLVQRDLNPSPALVFLKLSLIVLFVGLLNLTLCPQFGLSFVRNSGLMEYFMQFGSSGCRIFCGAFFMGTGILVATIILRPEDNRVLHKSALLQVSALGAVSLLAFVALGGEVYFQAALLWFLGCIVGGLFCLKLGLRVRKQVFA